MKFWKPLSAGIIALAVIVAPTTAAIAADQDGDGNYIRLATNFDQIDNLNPFLAVFGEALDVLDYQYEPLAGIDETGDYGPILASDFTVDGKTWTYTIQEDATWSDGEPVTADDVVWTYETIMNNPPLQVADGQSITNLESVTAVDDKTVKFTTKEPTPLHPGIINVLPKHVWEKIKDIESFENTDPIVGSGPFVLTEFKQGTSMTLKANEHYWRGKPKVAGLHLIGFKNTDARVLALRNGEIDMLGGMNSAHYDSLDGVKGVERYRVLSKHWWNLEVNAGWKTLSGDPYGDQNPVLEDVQFRQAISQAIDRKTLVDRVIGGLGSEGPTIIPPGTPGGFYTDLDGIAKPFDIEAAKQTLEDAGYTTDANGNRLDKDGAAITLRLMFDGGSTQNTATAEFFESWMKDLGIKLDVKSTNWDEMSDLIRSGKYDLYIGGWGVSDDPDYMLSINTCSSLPEKPGASASQSGMCDPEYDKVYESQRSELDFDKRKVLVQQALQMIYDNAQSDIFYYDDGLGAYRSDRLENLFLIKGSPYNNRSLSQATFKAGVTSGGGLSGTTIGVVVGVLLLAAVGGVFFAAKRKKSADDRK